MMVSTRQLILDSWESRNQWYHNTHDTYILPHL